MKLPVPFARTTNDAHPNTMPGLSALVLESLDETIIVVDSLELVTYINPAGQRLLVCTSAQVCGRPLKDCLVLKDGATGGMASCPLACLTTPATPADGQYDLLVQPDGREIPIEGRTTALHDEWGNITGTTILLHDVARSHAAIQHLKEQATRDHLTRLLNRREFERRLAQCVNHLREGETHALLYLDLDGFKTINDAAGHAAGDAALRLVASVFMNSVRDRDTLARIGGDEFGILLEHCPFDMATQHAEELRNELRNTEFQWNGRHFHLGVSIGLAMISSGASRTMHDFLIEADLACYAAKHARGTRPHCHPKPRFDADEQ